MHFTIFHPWNLYIRYREKLLEGNHFTSHKKPLGLTARRSKKSEWWLGTCRRQTVEALTHSAIYQLYAVPYHPKHQPCWLSIGSTNSTYCKGRSEAEMRQCMRRAQHRASRILGPWCPLARVFVCWGQFTAHHTPRGMTNRYLLSRRFRG